MPSDQWYFNIYEIGRAYGGSEEGGWYYDYGKPVESVPLKSYPWLLDDNGQKFQDESGLYARTDEVKNMISYFESKGFDFSGQNRLKTSPWDAEKEDFGNAQRYHNPDEAAEIYQEGSQAMDEFARDYPELLDKWYMDQYTDYRYSLEDHPAKEFPEETPYYE